VRADLRLCGGLNPALPLGTVVFDHDFDVGVAEALAELGALPAKFPLLETCRDHRPGETRALGNPREADAVEMESSVIRNLCREWKIPSATIRVISDTAHDDLPLDFNALMTSDDRIQLRQARKWPFWRRPASFRS